MRGRGSCEVADDGPVTVWSNWNVRETLPDPLLPLTWTFWCDQILPMVSVIANLVHFLFAMPILGAIADYSNSKTRLLESFA